MNFTQINFEQNSDKTVEFIAFAKEFKKQIIREFKKIGAQMNTFNVGHFYLSGFFYKGEQCYYFSWHNGDSNLMYRTAKDLKDFTGGSNCWIKLEDSFEQMRLK